MEKTRKRGRGEQHLQSSTMKRELACHLNTGRQQPTTPREDNAKFNRGTTWARITHQTLSLPLSLSLTRVLPRMTSEGASVNGPAPLPNIRYLLWGSGWADSCLRREKPFLATNSRRFITHKRSPSPLLSVVRPFADKQGSDRSCGS